MIEEVLKRKHYNIDNITMHATSPDFREIMFDLEVWDLKHLNAIISGIKAKSVVSSVKRVTD